jgi:predicted metal-dependent hydrolase
MHSEDSRWRNYHVKITRKSHLRRHAVRVLPNLSIEVRVSRTTSENNILELLDHHADWIEKHLQKAQIELLKFPEKKFVEGEVFPFLGADCVLQFQAGKKIINLEKAELICPLEWKHNRAKLQIEVQKFYAKEGKKILHARLLHYLARTEEKIQKVYFTGARTRWGSCSSKRNIRLNWKLVAAPLEVLDYVIVHELSHLRHMNHSTDFWHLVKQSSPNYKSCRNWLRKNVHLFDFLEKKSELYS